MHFKKMFQLYLKYTSLLNFWWTQSILETYFYKSIFKLFSNHFLMFEALEVKLSPKVYLTYALYLKYRIYLNYSSMSAGQNTSRNIHILWSNGLVVRAQVYQTTVTRFKTLRLPKIYISLSWCKSQSNKYQEFLGLGGQK